MKKEIEIPTICPSCSSELERVNTQLFCRNSQCPAQSTKKVEAFVKKMRIKGLGPARISTMDFVRPIEIYETHEDTYVEVLGDKIGRKIYNEVQNSSLTTFGTFLSALSIPLIGSTTGKKIEKVVSSFGELLETDLNDILGIIARDNLLGHIEDNKVELLKLESYMMFGVVARSDITPGSKGNICITGKLNDFSNRTKAKDYLEECGYTVTSTVSGKTNYLVCEDGSNSSKSKKAESLGIPIVTIVNLIGNKI